MMEQNSGISCREDAKLCPESRHCEEQSNEAIQSVFADAFWIASLRSQ
jgi:hypothetical protein